MTRVRVRNWPAERKTRELRKLLNKIDPTRTAPPPTPSPAMSLWERPTYKTEQMGSVRPGADAHQRIKSKGV